eukprot:CFRG2736T1
MPQRRTPRGGTKRKPVETNKEDEVPNTPTTAAEPPADPLSPMVAKRLEDQIRLTQLNSKLKEVIEKMENAQPTNEARIEIESTCARLKEDEDNSLNRELERTHAKMADAQDRKKLLTKEKANIEKKDAEAFKNKTKRETEAKALHKSAEKLRKQTKDLQSKIDDCTKQVGNIRDELAQANQALEQLEASVAAFVDTKRTLGEKSAEKDHAIDDLNQELDLYKQEETDRNQSNKEALQHLRARIAGVAAKKERELQTKAAEAEADVVGVFNRALQKHVNDIKVLHEKKLETAIQTDVEDKAEVKRLDGKIKDLKKLRKELEEVNFRLDNKVDSAQKQKAIIAELEKQLENMKKKHAHVEMDCKAQTQQVMAEKEIVQLAYLQAEKAQKLLGDQINEYEKLLDFALNAHKRARDDDSDEERARKKTKTDEEEPSIIEVTITGIVELVAVDPQGLYVTLVNETEDEIHLDDYHLIGVSHDEVSTRRFDFSSDCRLDARGKVTVYTNAEEYERSIGNAQLWETDPVWAASPEGPSQMKLYNSGGLVSAATISVSEEKKTGENCCIM